MTHQSFKDILTFWDYRDEKLIVEFLDGKNNDAELLSLFNLWKRGKQKAIFTRIKVLNETERTRRKNEGEVIPTDFDMPREFQNRNIDEFEKMKNRTRR